MQLSVVVVRVQITLWLRNNGYYPQKYEHSYLRTGKYIFVFFHTFSYFFASLSYFPCERSEGKFEIWKWCRMKRRKRNMKRWSRSSVHLFCLSSFFSFIIFISFPFASLCLLLTFFSPTNIAYGSVGEKVRRRPWSESEAKRRRRRRRRQRERKWNIGKKTSPKASFFYFISFPIICRRRLSPPRAVFCLSVGWDPTSGSHWVG